jgi:hypothetical protein
MITVGSITDWVGMPVLDRDGSILHANDHGRPA